MIRKRTRSPAAIGPADDARLTTARAARGCVIRVVTVSRLFSAIRSGREAVTEAVLRMRPALSATTVMRTVARAPEPSEWSQSSLSEVPAGKPAAPAAGKSGGKVEVKGEVKGEVKAK